MSFGMRLVHLFSHSRQEALVQQMATVVVAQCYDATQHWTDREDSEMTPAMVRGYVRARSSGPVAAALDDLTIAGHLEPELQPRVAARASDRLATLVADEMPRFRPSAEVRPVAA